MVCSHTGAKNGDGQGRNRTSDKRVSVSSMLKSPSLYQLSYPARTHTKRTHIGQVTFDRFILLWYVQQHPITPLALERMTRHRMGSLASWFARYNNYRLPHYPCHMRVYTTDNANNRFCFLVTVVENAAR